MNRKQRRATAATAPANAAASAAAAALSLRQALEAGLARQQAGDFPAAEAIYREILEHQPNCADALNLMGAIALARRRAGEAAELFRRATDANPRAPAFPSNLGAALAALGRHGEAEAAYRQALALDPELADAEHGLALALEALGRPEAAVEAYERLLACRPENAAALTDLGGVLRTLDRHEESEAACRRALALAPQLAEAHYGLGAALAARGRQGEAAHAYEQAIVLKPELAQAHHGLGVAREALGQPAAAVAAFAGALALDPYDARAHSNLIFCMNYDSRFSAGDVLAESQRWNEVHAARLTAGARAHGNHPDPDRRLRVGYVSPNLCQHSVGHFFEPLLRAHDRSAVEVFCYAEVAKPDAVTARLSGLADGWRSTVGLTHGEVAEAIRDDGIDVLVDLAGHTGGNRLPALAERPAPLQLTWLGYPASTGMAAIDYRLTDAVADPEGRAEALWSEKLLRLPGGFLCYAPPAGSPEVGPPPVQADAHVTFGSFNNLTKLQPAVLRAWAALLRAVPGSRLLLKSSRLDAAASRARVRDELAALGVAAERVEVLARLPENAAHLAAYGQVDIALDPFPWNGTTTTCEALWMGVPVVVLAGDRHAGRVGASMLSRLGLEELVAGNADDYVEKAAALAAEPERLARLRGELRGRLLASPLCDAAGFARSVEAAYREIWQRWCAARAVPARRGQRPGGDRPPLRPPEGFVFPRLELHPRRMGLTGVSPDREELIKIEVIRDPAKANDAEGERRIMAHLNDRGCLSCPALDGGGTLAAEALLPSLDAEQAALVESTGRAAFPYIVQQYVETTETVSLADLLLALLEQKALGVYHGDLKPEHVRLDPESGVCRFIDYDQAEFLDQAAQDLGNLEFLAWCDARARDKYKLAGFLQCFPGLDVQAHLLPHFRDGALNLGLTTLFRRQATTMSAGGIYHSLRHPAIFADGERDLGPRTRLLDGIAFAPGERVLDVGCNAGLLCHYLHDRGCAVSGIDLDASIVLGARIVANILGKDIRFACHDLDAAEIPGDYDTIMLFSVIHHSRRLAANARSIAGKCRRIVIECRLEERGAKPEAGRWTQTSGWTYATVDALTAGLEALFPGFRLARNHGQADRGRYVLELVKD